jgi:hypothetical protein
MAAHRIPLQDFRSNFVDEKILKVQDTSKKLKQLLLKDIQLSISQKDDTYYQPQSSLISARLQCTRLKQL